MAVKMIRPWGNDVLLAITQTFAEHEERRRSHGWKNYNGGLDMAPYFGNMQVIHIYAAAAGRVKRARMDDSGYGKHVLIDHGDGLETLYGHLANLNVAGGQWVDQGKYLGDMGSTGNSTGRHLHFEVRLHGKPVDPLNWITLDGPSAATGPEPIDEPEEELPVALPVFPTLPRARLAGGVIYLNIRRTPAVDDVPVGRVMPGQTVEVIRSVLGKAGSVWLQVGVGQFCALVFDGEQLMEFVNDTKTDS